MKYLGKSFSSPANSRAFVENWDAVFGDEMARADRPDEMDCPNCGKRAQLCETDWALCSRLSGGCGWSSFVAPYEDGDET